MGVNIFILDRRSIRLTVAGVEQDVGSLRRFWKITELDQERADELRASETVASAVPSPRAAMVVDVIDTPLGSTSGINVSAHQVIGWDEGRTSVTDMGWDYLPTLGYAVRNSDSGIFALHERRDGALQLLDHGRAVGLGLVGPDGQLLRRGQPVISECRSVRTCISGYAKADCKFDNGIEEKLLFATPDAELPMENWFVGKRPMDVQRYQRNRDTPKPD